MFRKDKLVTVLAEFFGTAVLATVILAVTNSPVGIAFFVAIGAAMAYAAMVMTLFPYSGSHYNPAITIGMWSLKRVRGSTALVYILAQVAGGIAAWLLYDYLRMPDTVVAYSSFDWRLLIAELIGATVLVFGYTSVMAQKFDLGRTASTLGVLLAVGMIIAGLVSVNQLAGNGTVINPAVELGMNFFGGRHWSWAYILGPLLGGIIGAQLCNTLYFETRASLAAKLNVSKRVRSGASRVKRGRKNKA